MKRGYAMESGRIAPQPLKRPTIRCVGCGCSEFHACPGPCRWIAVDGENGVGICSACVDKPIAELERSLAL